MRNRAALWAASRRDASRRAATRSGASRWAAVTAAIVAVAGCAVTGCSAAAGQPAAGDPAGQPASRPAAQRERAPQPAVVIVRHVVLPDGHSVTVTRFGGGIRFVLHCGSSDPGPACGSKVQAGPAVGSADRRRLVAAFNGGFKLSAGAGGYEQAGRIIKPLVRGRASLVIYRSGTASVGVWGRGVPQPGRPVYSVRQNLNLLVARGRPTAASASGWRTWGGTITGVELTARSALGENARGQLIYAASMSATPGDLAVALVRFGARIGMELDINQEWVQLAYAHRPGGALIKGVTGQVRPANQYLLGWTRDFVAVLATWVPAGEPGSHIRS
jgi:hypothetical protein